MRRMSVALVAGAAMALVTTMPVTASNPVWTRIASGLHSPRGVDVGPDGSVYVVEAGVGAGTSADAPGPTGEIIRIQYPRSAQPRIWSVATGLTSFGSREGETVGPDGISVDQNGKVFTIMAASALGTGFPDPQLGQLLRIKSDGSWVAVGNVGDRDWKWSGYHTSWAAHDFPDANPYGVLVTHGHKYVVDAGTNTLDTVTSDGHVHIVAFFPNGAAADATPTCITEGPDGALYVGTLSLVDSLFAGPPHPAASVWRVDPSQLDPRSESAVQSVAHVWATGFWPITGCNFDNQGNLWVSEFATGVGLAGPTGGALVKVPWAYPTDSSWWTTYGVGTLKFPGGVAADDQGNVYIANKSTSPSGTVLRLHP